tara:strand:+ start:92 stop:1549 length:1458 start_codon:yes stop_codon:yes gene_type:complete
LEDSTQNSGVYYALPQTVIQTKFTVNRKTVTASSLLQMVPEEQQADLRALISKSIDLPEKKVFFGKVKEVIKDGKTIKVPVPIVTCKVTDVAFEARSEPDPGQVYYVELKGGLLEKRDFSMVWQNNYALSSTTSDITDQTLATVSETLKSAAQIVGAVIPGLKSIGTERLSDVQDSGRKQIEIVLEEIKSIREIRKTIIAGSNVGWRGAMPLDTLNRILSELDTKEAKLVRVFTGDVVVQTYELPIEITPVLKINGSDREILFNKPPCLFKLDPSMGLQIPNQTSVTQQSQVGINGISSNAQNPVKTQVQQSTTWPAGITLGRSLQEVILDVSFDPQVQNQLFSKMVPSKAAARDRGYRYRIPALVNVKIMIDGKEIKSQKMTVAQLGSVAFLPAGLNTPGSKIAPVFDPETGALTKLNTTATPASTNAASSFIDSAKTIYDAHAAKEKAEAEASDELTQLQRQVNILDQKKKLRDLQDELGLDD